MLGSELVGRNVGILGVGREGLAVRRMLRTVSPEQGVTLYSEDPDTCLDEDELAPGDRLVLGPLEDSVISQHDVLVRSPGISPYRRELMEARRRGTRFESATGLWLKAHPAARTIAITGTKGKSTTSALLAHLLSAAGQRVALAGNIGVPLIECDPARADWWVLELSSYQLCDLEVGPRWGVILNLSDEHLDWHGGRERYREDKLRLSRLVRPGALFANAADPELSARLRDQGGVHWFNQPGTVQVRGGNLMLYDEVLYAGPSPNLPGAHNLQNMSAAVEVIRCLVGLPAPLDTVLEAFAGLPHRLCTVAENAGFTFIDDGLSTTPVATLAALEALQDARITVLVGGYDRGLDWGALSESFAKAQPHALVCLPDSGPRILAELEAAGLNLPGGMHLAENLDHGVCRARQVTPEGGVILLSPGAPSFPQFNNYRERSARFIELARE